MDMGRIRYFLAIAETGSFTKASERLFVSQPSLSAGIKKLERELGILLFERGGRGVVLTPGGRVFLHKARDILNEYQLTLQKLQEFKDHPTLKLGCLHTILGEDLANFMRAFRQEYPHLTIELYHGYPDDLKESLDRGDIDLAVTSISDRDNEKTFLKLFRQELLLAVPKTHPFAARNKVSLHEIDGESYIERLHCEVWRSYPHLFETAGIHPHIIYSADREEWVISLIQSGLGMSIMPVWKRLAEVVYVPIANISLSRIVGLKWRNTPTFEAANWSISFAASHNWDI